MNRNNSVAENYLFDNSRHAVPRYGLLKSFQLLSFTLAEVLIVLGILGLVADMTLPTLITNVNDRALSTAKQVANLKFEEALNQMRANDKLTGYATADAFANEFVKYIKTVDRCTSTNILKCFNNIITTSDNKVVETDTLKTGANIALINPENYPSNNVGITLPNGIMAILNYDKACAWKDPTNIGARREATVCLSMVYDVNGRKKPNKIGEDIVTLNAKVSTGFDCQQAGSICIATSDIPFSPISEEPLGENNYWAGARDACAAAGGRLPTKSELENFKLINLTGLYWSGSDYGNYYAYVLKGDTVVSGYSKGEYYIRARCVR